MKKQQKHHTPEEKVAILRGILLEQVARPNRSADHERIDYLERKLQTKDEALAELMAEHVAKTWLASIEPYSCE